MKITLALPVAIRLLGYAAATRMEYSGFGFCTRDANGEIFVYDFVLMDVGNEGYTEIDPKLILPLMEREDRGNMRVWIHRHPINNWSSRDLQTILREPMGSTPEQVGWSVSIVLTPSGWIGRIDNYVKGITKDLDVEPNVGSEYQAIREMLAARRPFQPLAAGDGVSGRDGSGVLEEGLLDDADDYLDEGWEEYEEDEYDEERDDPRDEETVRAVLEGLVIGSRVDPASITFAEILEDYGINWQKIRQKTR